MFYTAVVALKDENKRYNDMKTSAHVRLLMFTLVVCTHIESIFLCMLLSGATVNNTLDGIRVGPELYPRTSKKVPDINFYYRYLLLFQIFFSMSKTLSALRFYLASCVFVAKVIGGDLIL